MPALPGSPRRRRRSNARRNSRPGPRDSYPPRPGSGAESVDSHRAIRWGTVCPFSGREPPMHGRHTGTFADPEDGVDTRVARSVTGEYVAFREHGRWLAHTTHRDRGYRVTDARPTSRRQFRELPEGHEADVRTPPTIATSRSPAGRAGVGDDVGTETPAERDEHARRRGRRPAVRPTFARTAPTVTYGRSA